MKVLVACEESQAVTIAFRNRGIEAFSCDIVPCSGGHPEWHIQGDAVAEAYSGKYDLMVAHPPCTYLTNSGVRWLKDNPKRWDHLREGAAFFKKLLDAPIRLKAIENPIPHRYAVELIGRKYDQCVQPFQFGHPERKATCFWLEGLPPLSETENVKDLMETLPKSESNRVHRMPPGPDRAKLRSKTFQGMATAIASQWGDVLMAYAKMEEVKK